MSRNTSATKKTILHRIEGLFENKNNSVKDIRESLLKYSKEVGLDYHELNHIWDLAVASSEEIRNKVSISVIPFAKDKWLEDILVKHHMLCLEMLKDKGSWTEEDKERVKWDIKMSEEILYLIKRNDDCQFLALDGCQFTWLVGHLNFLKSIFENCSDTDHKNGGTTCTLEWCMKQRKENLKMVDQYLKTYMSRMLSLNRLITFLDGFLGSIC